MAFTWSEQKIKWFLDASRYTGYHEALAGHVRAQLEPGDTLCDLGCGLGLLDLELAGDAAQILAVDAEPLVINTLRQAVRWAGLTNLQALCMDATALKDSFDVVMMCFFGSGEELPGFLSCCRKKLICIVNAEKQSQLHPRREQHKKKEDAGSIRTLLDEKRLEYEENGLALEFGQPLTSHEEALRYVKDQTPGAEQEELEAFLQERLQPTDDAEFPLYLPYRKKLSLFVIYPPQG